LRLSGNIETRDYSETGCQANEDSALMHKTPGLPRVAETAARFCATSSLQPLKRPFPMRAPRRNGACRHPNARHGPGPAIGIRTTRTNGVGALERRLETPRKPRFAACGYCRPLSAQHNVLYVVVVASRLHGFKFVVPNPVRSFATLGLTLCSVPIMLE
jgi:hypothetical protein